MFDELKEVKYFNNKFQKSYNVRYFNSNKAGLFEGNFFWEGCQFVIFNSWKVPWNWIAFSQNSFVISVGLLYHLIKRDTGRVANEAFTSNPAVSPKQ